MSAHTPTPWQARNTPSECSVRAGGRVLFYASVGNYSNADADAAFIVRCVNEHDALLAALSTIIDLEYDTTEASARMAQMVKTARDAHAKATS